MRILSVLCLVLGLAAFAACNTVGTDNSETVNDETGAIENVDGTNGSNDVTNMSDGDTWETNSETNVVNETDVVSDNMDEVNSKTIEDGMDEFSNTNNSETSTATGTTDDNTIDN